MITSAWNWFGTASKTDEAQLAQAGATNVIQKNTRALQDVAHGTAYVFQQAQDYVKKNHKTIDKAIDTLAKVSVLIVTVQAIANHPWFTIGGAVAGVVASSHLTDIANRIYQTRQHLSSSSQLIVDVAAGYTIHYIRPEILTTLTGSVVSSQILEQAKGYRNSNR